MSVRTDRGSGQHRSATELPRSDLLSARGFFCNFGLSPGLCDGGPRVLFRKKKVSAAPASEPAQGLVPPVVLETLDRLQKAGVQLLLRFGPETYTTELVGLGRDAFF